jgi:beta-glucosidase
LKAFRKVNLKAGETQTVDLELSVKDFAFYNDKTNTWELESGEFILQSASSSANIKSKVSITIN